jgi:hypothetical protein
MIILGSQNLQRMEQCYGKKLFRQYEIQELSASGATCDTSGNIYLIGGLFTYTYRSYFGMKLDPNGNIDFIKEWNDSSITTRLEMFRPTFKDDVFVAGFITLIITSRA